MKQQFTITIYTEDVVGILNRVTIIFTRRRINIESIAASESELKGIHRYTIVINENEELVKKVILHLEKQVDVFKTFYYLNSQIVYQEIALYKVATNVLTKDEAVRKIVKKHNARILSVEKEFTVLEKTGHKEDTQELFDELESFGILEFVRSGRIAISKPMRTLKSILEKI